MDLLEDSAIGELEQGIPSLEQGIPPFVENVNSENTAVTKRSYKFHDRRLLQKSREITDTSFKKYFRMNRDTFCDLLELVRTHLPDGYSTNGKSLKTEEKLLCFLMYISSNMKNWCQEVRRVDVFL